MEKIGKFVANQSLITWRNLPSNLMSSFMFLYRASARSNHHDRHQPANRICSPQLRDDGSINDVSQPTMLQDKGDDYQDGHRDWGVRANLLPI